MTIAAGVRCAHDHAQDRGRRDRHPPPPLRPGGPLLGMAGYGDAQRAGFFANSQIEGRYLYFDPETFKAGETPQETVDELNDRFQRGAVELATEAVRLARRARGLAARGRRLHRHHHLHGSAVPEPRRPPHRVRWGCGRRCSGCTWATPAARARWWPCSRPGTISRAFPAPSRGDGGGGALLRRLLSSTTGSRARWRTRSSPTARAPSRCPATPTGPPVRRAPHAVPPRAPARHGLRVPGRATPRGALQGSAAHRRRHDEGDGRPPDGEPGTQEGRRPPLRAALRRAPRDRAGEEAPRPHRRAARPLPPRAPRLRQHVLRHRGLRAGGGAARRRAAARRLGPHDRARSRASPPRARCCAGSMPLFAPLARAAGVRELLDGPVPFRDLVRSLGDVARLNGRLRRAPRHPPPCAASRSPATRRTGPSPCSTSAPAAPTSRGRSCAGRAARGGPSG